MLRVESQNFFDNEIMELYPEWEPTSAQIHCWVCALQPFSKEVAVFALHKFYETPGGGFKKPKLGTIKEFCRTRLQNTGGNEEKADKEPMLLFALKCVENKIEKKRVGWIQRFYASAVGDTSRIGRYAEDLAEKFSGLYGGVWEILRFWDTDKLPF